MRYLLLCLVCVVVVVWHCAYAVASLPTLNGRTVQCCTLQQFPSVFRDETNHIGHGFSGLGIEYLTQLEVLIDFKCHSIKDFSEKTGFSVFVDRMHACSNGTASSTDEVCTCELGTGGWLHNSERFGKIDFLPPFLHDGMHTVVNIDRTFQSSEGTFYLTTYTTSIWLAILGLLIFFTVLKVFDRHFEPSQVHRRRQRRESNARNRSMNRALRIRVFLLKASSLRRLRKALQSTAERMIGEPADSFIGDSSTTRHWFLNFIISLCSIFLILTYGAAMTAKLLQETTLSPFSSIKDFQTCRISASDVCVVGGGSTEFFWKTVISPGYQSCKQNSMPIFCENIQECLTNIASGKCGYFFTDGITASYAVNGRNCGKIVHTGEQALFSQQGFIVPLNSSLTRPLALGTLWLSEMNMLKTLDQFYEERGPCIVSMKSTITIEKLKIFFMSAYSFCFLILLIMVFDPQDLGELHYVLDENCAAGNEEQCSPARTAQNDVVPEQSSLAIPAVSEEGQAGFGLGTDAKMETRTETEIGTGMRMGTRIGMGIGTEMDTGLSSNTGSRVEARNVMNSSG